MNTQTACFTSKSAASSRRPSRAAGAAMATQRARPVAAAVAIVFGLASPLALATNRIVSSCLDDGTPGTLRSVISAVTTVTGDTVDMSGLSCPGNVIALATNGNHIYVSQMNLAIKGPAGSVLTIDGSALYEGVYYNHADLFQHTNTGTLSIQDLALTGGHQKHKDIVSLGGCLQSAGNVSLTNVTISSCTNSSYNLTAKGGAVYAAGNVILNHSTISDSSNTSAKSSCRGGAIYAKGLLTLDHSTISGNSASCKSAARGGGVYAVGDLVAQYSTVSGNTSESNGDVALGGGLFAQKNLTLQASVVDSNKVDGVYGSAGGGAKALGTFLGSYSSIDGNVAYGSGFGAGLNLNGASNSILGSTISNNVSQNGFAGIDVVNGGIVGSTFVLRNSTVSGNIAFGSGGGLYVDSRTTKLYNSTIAFNQATQQSGVVLKATIASMEATLQSTLMSNNKFFSGDDDLDVVIGNGYTLTFNDGDLAAPANNLIRVTTATNLPTDTISGVCPHLGALRDNGGLTKTHALESGSDAIDAGNIVYLSFFDQRGSSVINGTADYLRVYGTNADIGAYEVQKGDVVFTASFEGCAPVPV